MKFIQLLLTATMVLLSSLAFAGEFKIAPVTIDLDNQWAEGNLIAARFSKNPHERIGCAVGNGVKSPFGDNGAYAYCEAALRPKLKAFCASDDPSMIDTIASINIFSYVYFEWKDDVCTHVTVATRSIHIPSALKP